MHFHELRNNLCWDNIPAAPKIQPGGEAGGTGTEFFLPILGNEGEIWEMSPHLALQEVQSSVIQQQLKGRKTASNDASEFPGCL